MRFNTLQQWLNWLESHHPSSDIELGLERVGQVAKRLGVAPTLGCAQVISVAGTNGKGSCVAALNALLRSANLRVGCYTSPHFIHYNERIVVDDQPVNDSLLIESFERVDCARQDIELTYFEFGTLVALDVFKNCNVDMAILEVGLGGRLDAVNIVDSDIAIVTSIDLDHQEWLGSDRQSIAAEKAGIFRNAKPAVCADPNPPQAISATAQAIGAKLLQRGVDFDIEQTSQSDWQWQGVAAGERRGVINLQNLLLPSGSIAAAIQAVQLLDVCAADIDYTRLHKLTLLGRFQSFTISVTENSSDTVEVILDVAHNPAAAGYLAEKLDNTSVKGATLAVLAMMRDKDCKGVVEALNTAIDKWFVAGLSDFPRAIAAAELADVVEQCSGKTVGICQHVEDAYRSALLQMVPGDRLIVLGSFITVSKAMMCLQQDLARGDSL